MYGPPRGHRHDISSRDDESRLTLAFSGEAAVASAKPAGNTIGEHDGEPASGPVRFIALLAGLLQESLELVDRQASITDDSTHRERVDWVRAGNREDPRTIRHHNVLALARHAKPDLLKSPHSIEVIDAGNPGTG